MKRLVDTNFSYTSGYAPRSVGMPTVSLKRNMTPFEKISILLPYICWAIPWKEYSFHWELFRGVFVSTQMQSVVVASSSFQPNASIILLLTTVSLFLHLKASETAVLVLRPSGCFCPYPKSPNVMYRFPTSWFKYFKAIVPHRLCSFPIHATPNSESVVVHFMHLLYISKTWRTTIVVVWLRPLMVESSMMATVRTLAMMTMNIMRDCLLTWWWYNGIKTMIFGSTLISQLLIKK